jgi:hypothetical protein
MRSKTAVMASSLVAGYILMLLLAPQPVHGAAEPNNPLYSQLETQLGRLYLNHKNLNHIYRNLHDVALDAMAGSDRQLSYIQKTYLFVNEANLMCFYQWELLSITDYIKEDYKTDYFTLRVKDLDRAIFESKDRVNSLKLYYGFIEIETARKLIDDAVGVIEANIYIYETLMDLLKPLANPPNPYEKDT